jgi:hypothetical protein
MRLLQPKFARGGEAFLQLGFFVFLLLLFLVFGSDFVVFRFTLLPRSTGGFIAIRCICLVDFCITVACLKCDEFDLCQLFVELSIH